MSASKCHMFPSTVGCKLNEILLKEIPNYIFSSDWEEKILNLIKEPHKKSYSTLIDEMLQEIRNIYFHEMRDFYLKNTLILVNQESNGRRGDETKSITKYVKIENPYFIKNQQDFSTNYFLSHKLLRIIFKISSSKLPTLLMDIKNYASREVMSITEISDTIKQDIKRSELNITKHFYLKIVKLMLQIKELKSMQVGRLKSLLQCASVVIAQLILNTMTHTINHLINSMQLAQNYPRMKLDLVYELSQISLKPDLAQVFSTFHFIIDYIAGIAQQLVPLEYWMKIDREGYIKVKLPEWFLLNSHARLQTTLENTFQTLDQYCHNINAQFIGINSEHKVEQEQFYNLCLLVETLNEFFYRAKTLVERVYFDVSTLSQNKASAQLQEYISGKTNLLLTTLVSQHQNFVKNIYLEFESLESRALDIPDKTKPLFELCDYMSHASKVKIKELENKIAEAVKMLSALLQIATLTDEHMQMNRKIIHKLWNVEQIFIQSNNLCESMKSVLEDELQRKTNVLNLKVDEMIPKLVILDDMDDVTRVGEYTEFLTILVKKIVQIEDEIQEMNCEEKLFKFPETVFPKVIEIKEILWPFNSLVHLICNWCSDYEVWMDGPFAGLNADEIERKTSHYHQQLTHINATFKLKIKTEMVLNKAFKFAGLVDDSDPMQHPAPLSLCWQALRDINMFQRNVPLATCMCNKSLTQRHWDEMSTIAGFDLTPNARTSLKTIVDFNLFDNLHKYQIISVSANKELALKNHLMAMIEGWNAVSFETQSDDSGKSIDFKFYGVIDTLLEDHAIKLEEMKCSNFVFPVEDKLKSFSNSLGNVRYFLEQVPNLFNKVNKYKTLYCNEFIENKFKESRELYQKTSDTLVEIQNEINDKLIFEQLFQDAGPLNKVREATVMSLNLEQDSEVILGKLRFLFPRLFFLNNTDIINFFDIKSYDHFQGSFRKCFTNLNLKLDDNFKVHSVTGNLGDEIRLNNIIETENSSEVSNIHWLSSLQMEIIGSLKVNLRNSLCMLKDVNIDASFDILNWINKTPAMIVLCICKIIWTHEIESLILSKSNIEKIQLYYKKQSELKSSLIDKLNNKINNRSRIILTALIMTIIYEENFLKHFIEEKIAISSDFLWQTQLKYYIDEEKVQVSTIDIFVDYGFEYYSLENPGIVITPLTERCYHSLIISYKNNLSGLIAGPACTGKTETIKSLAQSLAVLLYIFDCKTNFQHSFVKQILTGFVLSGSWLCFKNFCCIKSEIFSTVCQYINNIQSAKNTQSSLININDSYLQLNTSGFFCTTVNPGCLEKLNNYDEIKKNFRTISLMQPDEKRIVEISLAVAGFKSVQNLTTTLITILSCFNKQKVDNSLKHEFNLGTVMKIIEITTIQKFNDSDVQEELILFRTLTDICVPRLNEDEITVFQSLIQDAIPNISVPAPDYSHLLELLQEGQKSLCLTDFFKQKMLQLFEMIQAQSLFIIIGATFTGKTSLIQILSETLTLSFQSQLASKCKYHVKVNSLNQNALTLDRFHDIFVDLKWTDTNNDQIWNWLVFDGNLSQTQPEMLQTLFNYNSRLCTAKLSNFNNISIIFETSDIQNVSPSFVAKCGILYLDNINYMTYIKHEIKNKYANYESFMFPLIEWSITSCLKFLNKTCYTIIKVQNNYLILSTWKLLQKYLDHAFEVNERDKNFKKDYVSVWCQAAIVLSTVWALGGVLEEQSQLIFNTFCISLWKGTNKEFPFPKEIKPFESFTINEGQLREYFYVFKGAGTWKHYADNLKGETIVEDTLICRDPFVPTVDSVAYTTILQQHIKNHEPFILCSDSASGKSTFLKYFFENRLDKSEFSTNYYHVTASMSMKKMMDYILSKMVKTSCNEYRKGNKFCINFMDDLNLAMETDAEFIHELIRQHIDHGYWCDLNKAERIYLNQTIFCAALTKPNRNLCQRFLRHFFIYSFHPPAKDNMFRIFTNILLSNLKRNLFVADVSPSVNNIVNATLAVYNLILNTLKPIPSKFQYLFDLRDISRVISCCSLIHKDSVESKVTFVRLWAHEIFRVFGDKITDETDKDWLFLSIKNIVKSCFKDNFESTFDHLPKTNNNELNTDSFKQLFFSNFAENDKETEDNKKYVEVTSISALKAKIVQLIVEQNEQSIEKVDITVTNHVLENLVKICRILSIPRGNCLLISTHGSGRRVLALLASFIQKQEFVDISVASITNQKCWNEHLKRVLNICGASEKSVTFLCKDIQLNEQHLSQINSLIKFGEIPQLFSKTEWQAIVRRVRLLAQHGDRNLELSAEYVKEYFTHQCRDNLHFLICLNRNPLRKLKTFMRNYANLASCCFTDWWQHWPQVALQQVASTYLKNIKINDDSKLALFKTCNHFYNYINERNLRTINFTENYIPVPTTYLRVIKTFVNIFIKVHRTTSKLRNNYMNGLQRLEAASQRVKEMKLKLIELRQQLVTSSQETEATMREIEEDNASIENATVMVKADEEIANKKAKVAALLKTECEADLAVAIPILEDAIAALNTLKPTDITLVKAMKNPPDTVKLVMAAVCVMLEISADRIVDPGTGKKVMDYWGPSKRILGDMNFLQILKDYDKDNISSAVMQIIQKNYMTESSFQPRIVAKASSAAEGLCKWVRAMVSYDKVAKVVAPKKEKLAIANNECELAKSYLDEKRKMLSQLNDKLSILKNKLKLALGKKEQLQAEVSNCGSKLKKAEYLVVSLINEKDRWMETANRLQMRLTNIVGDMALASGIITYLGPFNSGQRKHIVSNWCDAMQNLKLNFSLNYNIIDVLELHMEIDEWHYDGLPKDSFSIENVVVMKESLQWTYLLLDPESIADSWIKSAETINKGLIIVRTCDDNYVDIIKSNMEKGFPVLVEHADLGDVDKLMHIISQPILNGSEEKQYMNFGDKLVPFDSNFKMYITCNENKMPGNINVYEKMIIIDFTLVSEALENQLLEILISRESPKFSDEFKDVETQSINNKKVIEDEENNILQILCKSKDIIEDESSINMLVKSKRLFEKTAQDEQNYNEMKNCMNKICSKYNAFTKFAVKLYDVICLLSNLNSMYYFSITWYIYLYKKSLETSNTSSKFAKLLKYYKSSLLKTIHSSVHRSLYENDKLIYSFLSAIYVQLHEDQLTNDEIDTFMKLNLQIQTAADKKNPCSLWLPETSWQQICYVSNNISTFEELTKSFENDSSLWQLYFERSLDFQELPSISSNLSTFQKIILVRIIRPDKVIFFITKFIDESIGSSLDLNLRSTVAKSYLESTCLTPMMFLLPTYSSPLEAVASQAELIGCSSEIINIYSGQQQSDSVIKRLIENARKKGYWIFIHNCQLSTELWLKKLDQLCDNFEFPDTSLDFRLWLSTLETTKLPVNIIQKSVKITQDNPTNLKQDLLKLHSSEAANKSQHFAQILLNLFFFHMSVCERKSFEIQSWNINYKFQESDFLISIKLLKSMSTSIDISYKLLTYILGKCIYGAKILDALDEKTLDYVLATYYNTETKLNILNTSIDQNQTDRNIFNFNESSRVLKYETKFCNFTNRLFQLQNYTHKEIDEIKDKESFVRCTINLIQNKLSIKLDEEQIKKNYPSDYFEPLNTALYEESVRYNKITRVIISSLCELEQFYNGHNVRSKSFAELERQMYFGQVPLTWKMNCWMLRYTERSLPIFIAELCERLRFIKNWIDNGHPQTFLLRALMIPTAIFTANKLKFSRNNNISFNQVVIDYQVVDDSVQSFAENEILLSELYLSGAAWNKDKWMICDNVSKTIFSIIPRICLRYLMNKNLLKEENNFDCPLYVSSRGRKLEYSETGNCSNYILNIKLRADVDYKYLIRLGVALYCDTD